MSSRSNLSIGALAAAVATSVFVARIMLKKKEEHVPKTASERGYELTTIQNFFVKACAMGTDHIVACLEISGKVPSKQALESAVGAVKQLDPNLDYSLVQFENDFVLQKTKDICGSVEVVRDKDWNQVAHDILNTVQFNAPTTDTPTSTWKLVLVQSKASSCLILVLHHVMFDGTSRNRLIHALLENLNPGNEICVNTSTVAVVAASEITKHTRYMSWWGFLTESISKFNFELKTRGIPDYCMDLSQAPGIVDENVKRETRQILFQLSQEETTAVIKRSKLENTTVHGALSAAGMLALETLNDTPSNPSVTMSLSHLISLWNGLVDYIPSMCLTGCFVSVARTTSIVNPADDPWILARAVKTELLTFHPKNMFQFLYSFKYDKLLTRLFGQELPSEYGKLQRSPTIAISNNGKVTGIPNDVQGLRIHGCYATSARNNTRGSLAVLNVQTVSGRMCISLSYYSQVWSDDTASDYVRLFRQTLDYMSTC